VEWFSSHIIEIHALKVLNPEGWGVKNQNILENNFVPNLLLMIF
jgi:hypothetical protein